MNNIAFIASIDLLATFILITLFINMVNKKHMYEQQDYIISIMLVISIFACITTDFVVRLLSGSIFSGSYELLTIFLCVYYILSPLPFVLWFFYAYKKCGKNFVISKKFARIAFIPFVINTILSFLSIWFNIYFKVIANNVYQRGDLFLILPFLICLYLFAAIIFVIKYRNNIKNKFFYFFILFPFLVNLLQIFFIGLQIQYPFFTIALLNIHLNFHDSLIDYDQLTGLFNRRHLINSLKSKIEKAKKVDKKLIGIMYDIDKFKIINDSFGHLIGDQAIIDAGLIIEKSLRVCYYIIY